MSLLGTLPSRIISKTFLGSPIALLLYTTKLRYIVQRRNTIRDGLLWRKIKPKK